MHGIVLPRMLPTLGPRRVATELVAKGFWQTLPSGGWCYRQWDKWQHELEQVYRKRDRDAERKRKERREAREKQMFGEEDDYD